MACQWKRPSNQRYLDLTTHADANLVWRVPTKIASVHRPIQESLIHHRSLPVLELCATLCFGNRVWEPNILALTNFLGLCLYSSTLRKCMCCKYIHILRTWELERTSAINPLHHSLQSEETEVQTIKLLAYGHTSKPVTEHHTQAVASNREKNWIDKDKEWQFSHALENCCILHCSSIQYV